MSHSSDESESSVVEEATGNQNVNPKSANREPRNPDAPLKLTDIAHTVIMTVEERDPRMSVDFHMLRVSIQQARGKNVTKEELKQVEEELSVDFHKVPISVLYERYQSSSDGLTDSVASIRLQQQGKNEIKLPSRLWPKIRNVLMQFIAGFCILLWVAAFFSFLAWEPFGGDPFAQANIPNLALAILLIIVILIQVGFNLYQEWTSSRVMASISKLLPAKVKVIRNGKLMILDAPDLVTGDIVQLSLGDRIPCDMRVISVDSLKVDSSILTGESSPITCTPKCTNEENFLESKNILFMGTNVVEGSGVGIVVRTAMSTLMGQITLNAMKQKQSTPSTSLGLEIRRFVLVIGGFAFGTGIIVLIAWGAWLNIQYNGFLNTSGIIGTAIGCIVAYVPEGLPICVTMTLTLIAKRMGKQNVLVKTLPIIETLGTVNVLCTDKTGTLTTSKMSIQNIVLRNKIYHAEKEGIKMYGDKDPGFLELLKISSLCNRSNYEGGVKDPKAEEIKVTGDGSDRAIFLFAENYHDVNMMRAEFPKLCEIPFNSKNKWMLTIVKDTNLDKSLLMMKGAPEILLDKCTTTLDNEDNVIPLTDEDKLQIKATLEEMAANGERVLAFTEKYLKKSKYPTNYNFNSEEMNFPIDKLCLVGFLSLMDPPRKEAGPTISTCHDAGIRVTMITGDYPTTAASIAKMVNIISGKHYVFDSKDFKKYKVQEMQEDADLPVIEYRRQKLNIRKVNWFQSFFFNESTKYLVPIFNSRAVVVKGPDVPELDDDMWEFILSHQEVVFGRTTPEQKLKIVQEYQKRGNVVAVTGDGVNDSPALRQADIGVAMGGGTDVAREAADMVLMDDNISSILIGILNGRLVFENLKKVIGYLIQGGCWCEMITILGTVFIGLPVSLSGFLMIFISVFTDVANSLSMTFEHAESDLMAKPPRSITGEKLVDWKLIFQSYVYLGTLQSVGAWIIWFLFMNASGIPGNSLILAFNNFTAPFGSITDQNQLNLIVTQGQCVYFVALVGSQMGNRCAMRTRHNSFFQLNPFAKKTRNVWLFVGMFVSYLLAVLIVNVPFFNTAFATAVIPAQYWFAPFITALVIILWDEARKFGKRNYPKYFWWCW